LELFNPECVNDFETLPARIYCRTPAVSRGAAGAPAVVEAGARLGAGGLIQTAAGIVGGAARSVRGGRRRPR
jgi:hypothetical protein